MGTGWGLSPIHTYVGRPTLLYNKVGWQLFCNKRGGLKAVCFTALHTFSFIVHHSNYFVRRSYMQGCRFRGGCGDSSPHFLRILEQIFIPPTFGIIPPTAGDRSTPMLICCLSVMIWPSEMFEVVENWAVLLDFRINPLRTIDPHFVWKSLAEFIIEKLNSSKKELC